MTRRGYSLIELVIVLAISGLILVLIFLGVNQANRDQRDNARKADANRYLNAVGQWTADHSGVAPDATQLGSVASTYITSGGATFKDPSVSTNWNVTWNSGTPAAYGNMYAEAQAKCVNGGVSPAAGIRQFAVSVLLEGGPYCVNK